MYKEDNKDSKFWVGWLKAPPKDPDWYWSYTQREVQTNFGNIAIQNQLTISQSRAKYWTGTHLEHTNFWCRDQDLGHYTWEGHNLEKELSRR